MRSDLSLEALKNKLTKEEREAIDIHYASFEKEHQKQIDQSIDLFVVYLIQRELLSSETLKKLRGYSVALDGIEDTIDAYIDSRTQTPSVTQHPSSSVSHSASKGKSSIFARAEEATLDLKGDGWARDLRSMTASEDVGQLVTLAVDGDFQALEESLRAIDDKKSLHEGYEYRDELGKGGMGSVVLAKQKALNRMVAIKQLHEEYSTDRSWLIRFLREAQVTAQLEHPGIVPIYSLLFTPGKEPAYTMKVVEGKTLSKIIKAAREGLNQGQTPESLSEELNLHSRLEYFLRVCEAIGYAHSKGVLHRDIKPANIMIGEFGEVLVLDWGIAKLFFREEDHDEEYVTLSIDSLTTTHPSLETKVGQVVGTPGYMSPEQARGEHDTMDDRSDQFSLGLILYELILLRPARKRDTLVEMLSLATDGVIQSFEHISPGVNIPRELEAIVQKATHVEPEQRYSSVRLLADDVRRWMHQQEVSVMPDSPFRSMLRYMSKHQSIVATTFLLLLLLGMLSNFWWLYQRGKVRLQIQTQEQDIARKVTQVTKKSYEVDRLFHRVESSLENVASATRLVIQYGQPSTKAYFLSRQFSPPDLLYSSFYQEKISRRWPSFKISSSTTKAKQHSSLSKLILLKEDFRRTLFSIKPTRQMNDTLMEKHLLRHGLPIHSVFVGTKEGTMALFPGRGSYPASYDPRLRPWYRQALRKKKIIWTKPYVSSLRVRAILMACTLAIHDKHQNLLGVVGVDVRLNHFVHVLRGMKKKTGWIDELYLVNEQGRVVISSEEKFKRMDGKKIIQKTLPLHLFPDKRLQEAFKLKKRAGHFVKEAKGKNILLGFVQLQSLPWYFVVKTRPF